VPPEDTLVVFDFDCTLSAVHLFHTLRSPEGQQEFAADRSAFFSRIWGGAERMGAVQRFLRTLKAQRFTVYILSFGNEREIVAALKYADVLHAIDGIYGNQSYARAGVTAIQTAKVQMLDVFREKTQSRRMFFADDDRNNFPDPASGEFDRFAMDAAEPAAGRDAEARASDDGFGLGSEAFGSGPGGDARPEAVGAEVVVFPAGACNGGDGLSVEDMSRVQLYLAQASGLAASRPPPAP
jgi:hypothetical protein